MMRSFLSPIMATVMLGVIAEAQPQPLTVQNQQTGPDSVNFTLVNPRSVAVTAFAVSVLVTFSDGYQTTLTDLVDGYLDQTMPIAAGGTRDENFPLPTRTATTVTATALSVDATVYDDVAAAGNPKKIAQIVGVRKLDVRETQRILDRLQKAQASADPIGTLAALADKAAASVSRTKAHQRDYDAILAALKSAQTPGQLKAALAAMIQIQQTRLARAQQASGVQQ
jgi:hypothetical protein